MKQLSLAEKTEASQYHLKAQFILNEVHANIKVYGSNAASPNQPNVNLALQYINRSLEIEPENVAYLNLKALLLWEGMGEKQKAIELLEKALVLKPNDIDVQNNLNSVRKWKPARVTPVGYLSIALGLGIVYIAFTADMNGDVENNFKAAVGGFVFILFGYYAKR